MCLIFFKKVFKKLLVNYIIRYFKYEANDVNNYLKTTIIIIELINYYNCINNIWITHIHRIINVCINNIQCIIT